MDPANQNNPKIDSTLKAENQGFDHKLPVEKELLVWVAPARPFKRRDKQFYITIVSIAAMISLILFLAEGAMPVILIISLIFLYYIMSTVEPEKLEIKITDQGIKVGEKRIGWEYMGRFWFGKRYDSELLIIETSFLPNKMEIVMDSSIKDQIKKTISDYLVFEQMSPSKLDKAIEWFSKKLPQ